jgi:hypothetical protein
MTTENLLSETELLAEAIGRGLVAGLLGTLAITATRRLDAALSGKKSQSKAPAEAIEEVLDIMPINQEDEERLSVLTHFGYGTTWGLFRAALDEAGVTGWTATAVHFSAIFGTALVLLPKMGVMEPVTEWRTRKIVTDAVHHAIYATVTGVVYDALKETT